MKKIKLTKGKYALVDDADFETLSKFNWYTNERKRATVTLWYGRRAIKKADGGGSIYIHNQIMNPPEGMLVDHINGNGLDNRRSNLRLVTYAQNAMNRTKAKGKSSKYTGVYFCKNTKKFIATISVSGSVKYLGRFPKAKLAAKAYNEAAKVHHGEYARLNPV